MQSSTQTFNGSQMIFKELSLDLLIEIVSPLDQCLGMAANSS